MLQTRICTGRFRIFVPSRAIQCCLARRYVGFPFGRTDWIFFLVGVQSLVCPLLLLCCPSFLHRSRSHLEQFPQFCDRLQTLVLLSLLLVQNLLATVSRCLLVSKQRLRLMVEDLATVSRCLLKLDLPVYLAAAAAAAIANYFMSTIFGASRGVESLSNKAFSPL